MQSEPRPKNARLIEAIRQNADARVRSAIWALGMVEDIYAEVDARHRRAEDAVPFLGGVTVPELVVAYFHHKFGSKAIVDDYLGSLSNTLVHLKKVQKPLYSHTMMTPCQGIEVLGTLH